MGWDRVGMGIEWNWDGVTVGMIYGGVRDTLRISNLSQAAQTHGMVIKNLIHHLTGLSISLYFKNCIKCFVQTC